MQQPNKTKRLVVLAMLSALAYALMLVGRIPIVMFLKYDPKDVIIAIGGFLMGPLAAVVISVLSSTVEMFTASDTGIIGLIMNVLGSCAFACTAAVVYKKHRTLKHAIGGLALGTVAMTAVMLLWNYLITPLYLGYPREAVAELLVPVFLPFNLLKAGINAALTMLLYKPVSTALRRAGLMPPSETPADANTKKVTTGAVLFGGVLLATCVLLILVFMGKL